MKTIVYVDGYNLYYSILRQSRYKWLDMVKLFLIKLTLWDIAIWHCAETFAVNHRSTGIDSHPST